MNHNKKLAIVRSSPIPLNIKLYNVQEIGLAIGLAHNNISTDIFSRFDGLTKPVVCYSHDGCDVRLIPIKGLSFFNKFAFYPGLFKRIRESKYNYVQLHEDSQITTPIIINLGKKVGTKLILYQGMYQYYTGMNRIIQILFDVVFKNSIIRNINLVIAKTNAAKKYLELKRYKNVHVLPIGLSFPSNKQLCSAKNIIDNFKSKKKHILLYIGIIEGRRNIPFIIAVLEKIIKNGRCDYGLIIVGDGPQHKYIYDLIVAKDLVAHVLLIPSIPNDQLWYIYQSSDIFLLPSQYEIYGMVVLEALFYGIPVISSETAGPKDIITNDILGACLPFNINIWIYNIHAIISMESNENKNFRFSYIKNNFDWRIIAEKYINMLASI